MSLYPLLLSHGADRKPQSNAKLVINERSPYRAGLAFDWCAGDTQYFDSANVATIRPEGIAPKKLASRRGLVTEFQNGISDALLLGAHAWIDIDRPWSLAFDAYWYTKQYNQCFQLKTTGSESFQLLFATDSAYADFWAGTSLAGGGMKGKSGTGFAPADQWNRILITFDGKFFGSLSSYRYYSNGVARTPVNGNITFVFPNQNRLGRTDGADRYFYGRLAKFRIWQGRQLSEPLALEHSVRSDAPFGVPITYRADEPLFFFVPDGAPPPPLAPAVEVGSTPALGATKAAPISAAQVQELAPGLAATKAAPISAAQVQELAPGLAATKAAPISPAQVQELAPGLAATKAAPISPAVLSEIAVALPGFVPAVEPAVEQNAAPALGAAKRAPIAVTAEQNATPVLGATKRAPIAAAVTSEIAVALPGFSPAVDPAVERNATPALGASKSAPIAATAERNATPGLGASKRAPIAAAVTSEIAVALPALFPPLVAAVEINRAMPLGLPPIYINQPPAGPGINPVAAPGLINKVSP